MNEIPKPPRAAAGDGSAAGRVIRPDALVSVGLAAIVILLLILALPLFTGKIYPMGDMAIQGLPFRSFYARCLSKGENFFWLPGMFCGYDLHGDGNEGLVHPLHWVLYRVFPLAPALNLELLADYLLMLPGMYLFLIRWKFPRAACLFGAMAFTFCGFNLLHYLHPNMVAAVAHIPWMLWAIDIAIRDPDARRAAWAKLAVGLLTASQLTVAFPQVVWFTALLEVGYVVLVAPLRVSAGRLLTLAAAKGLGILAGAIQWLPTYDALKTSVRADESPAFLNFGSVFPGNFVQFVGPYLFGTERRVLDGITHELGIYSGAVVTALLLLVFLQRRELGLYRRLATACFMAAGASLILILGKYGGVYHLQSYLPTVGKFRCPCRYIVLFQFAAAIIGAMGFAWLYRRAEEGRPVAWRRLWPLGLLPLAGSGAALTMAAWLWIKPACRATPLLQKYAGSAPEMILSLALVLAGTLLVIAAARGKRWAFAGMILFVALDQGLYGISYIWQDPPATVAQIVARAADPPARVTGRICVFSDAFSNLAIMKGQRLANGYVGMTPRKQLPLYSRNALRVAGVEWIRDDGKPHPEELLPSWVKETLTRTDYGWRLPDPLPRARLVRETVTTDEPASRIDEIDAATTALVPAAISLPPGAPGTATIVTDKPGRITVTTRADSRQLLVLSESYHSGWRATVDGKPAPVLPTYGDFMGCVVEAGEHRVEWVFRPRSLILGAWISLAGLAGLLGLCLTEWALASRPRDHNG